jgi:hypothetical protein
MINSKQLLSDLQKQVRPLEDDLRSRCDEVPEVDAPLRKEYEEAKQHGRTALTYAAWRDAELTQIAVAWVLGCVFVRFLEDNELVETPKLSGPGNRLRRARDEHELFFRQRPTDTEREYLQEVLKEIGQLPAMREFFDKKHNPLWLASPSGDACRELWQFWQKTDPETGELEHDFTDPDWNTRFLGDLYQYLSEAARKRYALLQTPDFVEEFILDRTLTPAIESFGYREVRLIDPTCGSGHFLLGAFARLFRIWQEEDPGANPRVSAQQALGGVHGVDVNPYAVAIARFRLLLAALRVCGVKQLRDAPIFQIHLAVGDSLLHGPEPGVHMDRAALQLRIESSNGTYQAEDAAALAGILSKKYHAVVGNPPYITIKDEALGKAYRSVFKSAYREFALTCPFMERFFDLAIRGDAMDAVSSGLVGKITANSFMRRDFGRNLIEKCMQNWELRFIVDTSGANIPGHGISTAILFGENRQPRSPQVRILQGKEGEVETTGDPAHGKVWTAITEQIDVVGTESRFISVQDVDRRSLYHHPWTIGGGDTSSVKELMETSASRTLSDVISNIGYTGQTNADDVFIQDSLNFRRHASEADSVSEIIVGKGLRDWQLLSTDHAFFPYTAAGLTDIASIPILMTLLWPWRTTLWARATFSKRTYKAEGRPWWEWHQMAVDRLACTQSISFPSVETHNHFVLLDGVHVFKQSAASIDFDAAVTQAGKRSLCAILNSSVACLWMKQVMQGKTKGDGGEAHASPEGQRFDFTGSKLKPYPLPPEVPKTIPRELNDLGKASENLYHFPNLTSPSRSALAEAQRAAADLRARMISLQEELDWQCYRLYGLFDADDNLEWPEARLDELPALDLGERAFEIRMARQMAAGELETTWFERHKDAGSKPITELPFGWPVDYRGLVERRLAFIESNKSINLIERPEYKRRWNTEPCVKRQKEVLRRWLLARLESYFFEGSRVCDLGGCFDPSAHGFTAATRPHLATANQLADVVQSDPKFLDVAEVYEGANGFSVPKLIRTLVGSESVPFLPIHRYKDSGLRKRQDWETTWELQRTEDSVEAKVRAENQGADEEQLKKLIRKAQQEEVGNIPVPPKYSSKDFIKTSLWKLRGKLDVPKERWISYPGAERAGEDSLLIAWAGWDHLQQAQALAEYFIDARDNQGWPPARLEPLLAGLADLIPWLRQWHNDHDPAYGMGLGDYFSGFLEEQCRGLELTVVEVDKARFANPE